MEAVAVFGTLAAVTGTTMAVVNAMDTSRRAEHAAEDAAAQTSEAITWERQRTAIDIENARTKTRKAISTIMAQTGKMGFKLDEDSSPAYLIDYSNEQYRRDVELIQADSELRIKTRNWNQARTESQASALASQAYMGAFSIAGKGLSDLAIIGKGYKVTG